MGRYRTGRKNGHTVYLQMGDEPRDTDPFVGSCVTRGQAANLVRFANAGLDEVGSRFANAGLPAEETQSDE
jgi:hypothetical protein